MSWGFAMNRLLEISTRSALNRKTRSTRWNKKATKPEPKRRIKMPYVNIRVAGKLSKKQKENICKGVTEVIAREAAKPPEAILIFIDEVEHENIAKAGILLQAPK